MSTDPRAEIRLPGATGSAAGTVLGAALSYAALLAIFWQTARWFKVSTTVDHFPSAFASFALLWAPYWFFGFGLAPRLRAALRSCMARTVAPVLLVIPYLVFALPRHEFRWNYAAVFVSLPVALAALLQLPRPTEGITWADALALALTGVPVEFSLLRGAWPGPGLGSLPKVLLMDAALYGFLVVRALPDTGYDFRPRWRDLAVGLREWALFAPIAIALGVGIGFIHFRAHLLSEAKDLAGTVVAAGVVTFFFVAIPEELFFRGLLQNLLEKRFTERGGAPRLQSKCGPPLALLTAAFIFGLSHFNKPLPFNWRYVLLATIAGIFYGRAWRDRRRLFCSGITHATVDVVWSLWFR